MRQLLADQMAIQRPPPPPGVDFITLFAPYAEHLAPYAQLLKSFYWCKSSAQKIGVGCRKAYEINLRTVLLQ